MNQITIDQVKKTYTDHLCSVCLESKNNTESNMSYCNGQYSLPSHVSIEDANKVIGYDGFVKDDVSDVRINECLNTVNNTLLKYENHLINGLYQDAHVCIEKTERHVYVRINDRTTVIYF